MQVVRRSTTRIEPRLIRRRQNGESIESLNARIAERAHEIYEARGGEHGKALEDWLEAEREIDGENR
jgi:hypothetical protein